MKNIQKILLPAIVIVVAVLIIGSGIYLYQKHAQRDQPSLRTDEFLSNAKDLTVSDIYNSAYAVSSAAPYSSRIDSYAFGDINGDGRGDAVVVTKTDFQSRDAQAYDLQIVLNSGGKPEISTSTIPLHSGEALLTIKAISISDSGLITLQIGILPSDGNVYNPVLLTRTYRYKDGSLTEAGY